MLKGSNNPKAAAMGSKGGMVRARTLTKEQRVAQARKAVNIRWARFKNRPAPLTKGEAIDELVKALWPFANDYYEGDTISSSDVTKAREILNRLLVQGMVKR